MRFLTAVCLLMISSVPVHFGVAASNSSASFVMSCDYSYYGSPFAQVKAVFLEEGYFQSPAEITHYGKVTTETLTEEVPEGGELYRLTISKESPENWLTLIVYPDQTSKLINPHIPIAKEMTGQCVFTSTELNSKQEPL